MILLGNIPADASWNWMGIHRRVDSRRLNVPNHDVFPNFRPLLVEFHTRVHISRQVGPIKLLKLPFSIKSLLKLPWERNAYRKFSALFDEFIFKPILTWGFDFFVKGAMKPWNPFIRRRRNRFLRYFNSKRFNLRERLVCVFFTILFKQLFVCKSSFNILDTRVEHRCQEGLAFDSRLYCHNDVTLDFLCEKHLTVRQI